MRQRLLDLLALPAVPLAAALSPLAAHRPAPHAPVAPLRPDTRRPLSRGDTVSVLSWNIQFSAGRGEPFFYDGGPRVHATPEEVEATLSGIAAVLRERSPSVTFLQEVDRDATRTGRRDQLRALMERLPGQSAASATYWRAPFVPTPLRSPVGRVNMHLSTLTPHGIAQAHRTQLALLDEPRVRRMFNLKRALLTADIPVQGGGVLKVANTHLSAFSFGDGTLDKQVDTLAAWMDSHPPDQPWLLAGDFNLLPPTDDPERLALSRPLYASAGDNPLRKLIPRFQVALDTADPALRTYLPHGSAAADRTIDYIFYGGPLSLEGAGVLREKHALSDHLPLWADFRL